MEQSRRNVLRYCILAGIGALAGCLRVSTGESTQTNTPSETEEATQTNTPSETGNSEIQDWETNTDGDANVEVVDTTEINLRVFKCSNATASTKIGETSGDIEITFDYEVEAEQWFEQGMFVVIEDGTEIYRSFESGKNTLIDHSRGATETGSVRKIVSVDGDVDIEFRIEPSPYCNAGDHGNTFLRVDNIEFEIISN